MNLLLLRPEELRPDGTVRLTGRRQQHALEVLKVQTGDTVRLGVRGGQRGEGTVLSRDGAELVLRATLGVPPPARPGIDLVLAVPRPKALKRVIPAVASLGVDRVMLVNAARVEKSYFDSKVLAKAFLDELIDLGLEQACDTVAPRIELRERLKPFVEDELDAWAGPDAARLLPHPTATARLGPLAPGRRAVVAIGPDGGWVPFEVDLFQRHGFTPQSLGERILRVEVAVPTVLGALAAA